MAGIPGQLDVLVSRLTRCSGISCLPLQPPLPCPTLQHGGLDEKGLAEQTLIPAKEAKELLFKLVTDGVVQVQEVPRRADRHPQFTFYVFMAVSSERSLVARVPSAYSLMSPLYHAQTGL